MVGMPESNSAAGISDHRGGRTLFTSAMLIMIKKGIIRPTRCVVAVLAHQEDVLVDILVGVPVQAGLLHASHTGHGVLHSNTLDIY